MGEVRWAGPRACEAGMGAGPSTGGATVPRHKWRRPSQRRSLIASTWQSRQLPRHVFGVVRHARRADSFGELFQGQHWTHTEDFKNWPIDPPLSDAGGEGARELGRVASEFAAECASRIHVVVASPYRRCIQTAIEICKGLGPGVRLIVDLSLGEVFGPDIMGDSEPACPVRPFVSAFNACEEAGVDCVPKAIGKWPSWPEDLRAARQRVGCCFITYLQRSMLAQRNFVLVTHADAVGAAASLMPSLADRTVRMVDYGGGFFAQRKLTRAERRRALHPKPGVPAPCQPRDEAGTGAEPSGPASSGPAPGDRKPQPPGPTREAPEPSHSGAREGAGSVPLGEHAAAREWMHRARTDPLDGWGEGMQPAPGIPSASTGWKVRAHGMTLHRKAHKAYGAGWLSLSKAMRAVTRDVSFTQVQIEHLLGQMPGTTLGVGIDDAESDVDSAWGGSECPCPSLSTLAFGGSELPMCPSEFSRQVSGQTNASFDRQVSSQTEDGDALHRTSPIFSGLRRMQNSLSAVAERARSKECAVATAEPAGGDPAAPTDKLDTTSTALLAADHQESTAVVRRLLLPMRAPRTPTGPDGGKGAPTTRCAPELANSSLMRRRASLGVPPSARIAGSVHSYSQESPL